MSYNYGQCKICKKTIQYEKTPICQNCYEENLLKVKKFISENGESTTQEINKATKVPIALINIYLQDGILIQSEEENEELKEALQEKKEKEDKRELLKGFKGVLEEMEQKQREEQKEKEELSKPRMRFFGN